VLQNVGNIWNVLGYCGGFAAGTLVGLALEEKLALGYVTVQAISQTNGVAIASVLRDAGYGATEVIGKGRTGSVYVVTTVVKRRKVSDIVSLVNKVDEHAFVTVDNTGRVLRGHLGPSQEG